MKNKKWLIISLVALLGITGGIVKYRFSSTVPLPEAVWVQASFAKEMTLPLEIHAIGTLLARSVEITPEVAGHVEKIFFQDGTYVKKGSLLIQFDDAIYKAKYASSEAELAYSENNFKRAMLLGKQGVVSRQAVDQANADLKEKRAAAKESEVMLNKMKLIAPFDGIVGKSKVNPGDYVTIGQGVVTLTNTKHLHVEYNIPEKYLSSLKLNQSVSIQTAAYPEKTFFGKVAFISPIMNTDNRSISLYAEVPNENNLLATGMFVNVTQSLGQDERVLMISARSLVPVLEGEQVYKIIDGKAYAVNVLIAKRTENGYVQVVQGVSVGDQVITDGQLKLKNGMPVHIKN